MDVMSGVEVPWVWDFQFRVSVDSEPVRLADMPAG